MAGMRTSHEDMVDVPERDTVCLNIHTWVVFRRGRVDAVRRRAGATPVVRHEPTSVVVDGATSVISSQSSPTEREYAEAYPQLSKRISPS